MKDHRPFWLRKHVNPWLLDVAIAAVLTFVMLIAAATVKTTAVYPNEPDLVAAALVLVGGAALAVRRHFPLPVFLVTAVVSYVSFGLGYPDHGLPFTAAIAFYTVASRCSRRTTILAGLATAVSLPIAFALRDTGELNAGTIGSNFALFAIAGTWGDRKQVRDAYFEQLELRASDQERQRIEAANHAVSEERIRIARELHDVVAHAMSVIAVQSGVAAHVVDGSPGKAKELMQTVNDASRDALAEMRRLLGVLRDDPQVPGELAPAPGLSGVEDLAARVTGAGVPVTVRVEGSRGAMPAGVDLAAYRIVQEALTNVLKHAGTARAEVQIRYEPHAVSVEVYDDGRGAAAASAPSGGGQGLIGMRERAALYGGTLTVGPVTGGGYLIAATLPFATRSHTAGTDADGVRPEAAWGR